MFASRSNAHMVLVLGIWKGGVLCAFLRASVRDCAACMACSLGDKCGVGNRCGWNVTVFAICSVFVLVT